MPGATTARLVVLVFDMPMKLSMIPQTVPNRPTNGATAPIVARIPISRDIARALCASRRESNVAARSLMPSAASPSERSASPTAAATRRPTGDFACPNSFSAPCRLVAWASISRPRRADRFAPQSSIIFASMTVQVARDAMASPTITIFTGRTALRNIPQGERSCGKVADSKPFVRGTCFASSIAGSDAGSAMGWGELVAGKA